MKVWWLATLRNRLPTTATSFNRYRGNLAMMMKAPEKNEAALCHPPTCAASSRAKNLSAFRFR
jgi:hypothetical protein